ncbi:N-acetylneuraminate synthase family protein [Tessaracoccus sp. MC1627]|uniref:N-acetylneuraminate synthase family protein n=1 Tax=Tessaracoccus sp. MC1627 TaxID=2760312 RepID=UPI0015FEEAEA|nr:N-acetylneuraminate synthase family protein [Tessaracoccus sp. MC1627]MBB1513189.1 N-acetylneuraminate synthase family protein [Tessaracoccus sp. MC1627]MBB1513478.1 N-acetylneuraminate synthase family protein [Tessaracoccus sp. MC1627]
MIIERRVGQYLVRDDEPLLSALRRIDANKSRIVFVVDNHGHLVGSLTDGDVRRWLIATPDALLDSPSRQPANASCVRARIDDPHQQISALITGAISHVPLLDDQGRLVAVASNDRRALQIGRHRVSAEDPTLIIAEIGNNHQGDVDFAKELVDLAVDSGADVVKFQLRDMDALYRQTGAASGGEDLGAQYTLNLLAKYSLSAEQMVEVFDHCRAVDVDVLCTPWDSPSVKVLADYGVPGLKVASADMTNHTLLDEMFATGLPLIVSTGMSTEAEIIEAADLLRSSGSPFAMLHCQSTYPAPFKDINLRYLSRLAEIAGGPVGYSGHERGYHVPLAAVAMGARIIEKHFTTDQSLEGNDHRVSLLPGEFRAMVARIRELEESLGNGSARVVSTGESMNRVNLAKSLVATRRINVGERIGRDDVTVKSPGRGLQPNKLHELLGRTAGRAIEEGDFFYAGDLSDAPVGKRNYSFRRPWGLPVRYHDFAKLAEGTNPDFVEFHLSYKDVELDVDEIFAGRLPYGFTVHLPDLYAGDFIVNLASPDDVVWERSIAETQRVIDLTRHLTPYFTQDEPPVVIATMGGFTADGFVDPGERPAMYARIAQAIERLDTADVRLTAQTLPPYPWLMGGQQYHNLFMGLDDTVDFCEQYGQRITLDISHSKLAATFHKLPFSTYVEKLAPLTEHLHIVDAEGVDGEGPQIGDGEVDWPLLARQLDDLSPGVGFIPEIWMGHTDGGAGFWTALERLEQWF